ncbi:hypothetical protein SAMN04488109_1136 [Chryseolinea serpens]|uniref:Uncharacterized protein n=1 Tax=Chryseolinea serpens TaxID=947013 RepID=A0A1M5LCF1_9BACT|nr:hypothetical protein [Chryseolinea serpens]SHG62688.1 hypothetical protein SAMN04488109_1136 [Chryseolinea serpens]
MNDEILKDYGWCQVIKRGDKYIIRYDKGGVAIKMIESEVSKKDANRALANQLEAEKVIIEIQKRASSLE